MQTRNMIREAATSTDVRKQKIYDILRKLQPNMSETVKQFGLNISNQFAEVDARLLNPPALEYGGKRTVMPRDGVWRAENMAFIQPRKAINWAILILDGRTQRRTVEDFRNTVRA